MPEPQRKYKAGVVLLGVQTDKRVFTPVKEIIEAATLADAIIKLGNGLQGQYNNDMIRIVGLSIDEID